jgi:hypothetical protein
MIEITFGLAVICLAGWNVLNYLDSMGQLQKKLRFDSLMQSRCKALANAHLEEKFVCSKCTDIKVNNEPSFFKQINRDS